jgi:hypothetical protein
VANDQAKHTEQAKADKEKSDQVHVQNVKDALDRISQVKDSPQQVQAAVDQAKAQLNSYVTQSQQK